MYLKKIRFYIYDAPIAGSVILEVYKQNTTPGTAVYSQVVPSVTAMSWNEVTLTTPVLISNATDMWFGYQVTSTAAATYPAGMDVGPAVTGHNWFDWGGTWYENVSQGFSNNWNIQGWVSNTALGPELIQLPEPQVVTDMPVAAPADIQSFTETAPAKKVSLDFARKFTGQNTNANSGETVDAPLYVWPVLGYNIYRNSVKINGATPVTNLYYDNLGLSAGTYSFGVTAVYAEGESEQCGR